MKQFGVNRFNRLYEHYQRTLKIQGKVQKIIYAYSRAIRRIALTFVCS
ncbi:MAG: hypothetical protein JW786_04110 [Desulfobacterales bacterium]|nr:hypothetical protein [Desulfobacterales bacterium]